MATEMNFGILGSGNMARVYGDALTREGIVPKGRLTAIALGSRAPALAAEYPGVDAEPNAEALLARPDIDVVVIATPHSTHLALAKQVAAAGKHIYLEKPMALDVNECDQIIEACRAAGVQLTIAKQTRHMEMSMRAKEHIDNGRIGDILFLRPTSVTPGQGFVNVPQSWPDDPREGDAFLDWGAHACDATRWLTGAEPVRMYADYDNLTGIGGEPDPTVLVQARLSNRTIAQMLLCYEIGPSGFGTRRNTQYLMVGTKGSVFFDLDRCELWTGATDREVWELPSWTLPDFKPRDPRRIGNTSRQIVDFIDAVLAGRSPRITGEDGRKAIEMTQAARLSAKTGRAINLPMSAEDAADPAGSRVRATGVPA
jgi:myo-inositol 2-dehydrogenase/D-chiro-inositol 1-dehydrogenase/scyllo-inositol 2-dehydrogenase (NAD+)